MSTMSYLHKKQVIATPCIYSGPALCSASPGLRILLSYHSMFQKCMDKVLQVL